MACMVHIPIRMLFLDPTRIFFCYPNPKDTVPYLLLMNMDAIELQQLTPSSQVGDERQASVNMK
jgi:hypothetical protein